MFIYVIQWRHFEGHLSKFETYFFFLVLLYVKTSSSDVWSGRRELFVCVASFIISDVFFFFLSWIFFQEGAEEVCLFFFFKTLARALEISFSCTRKRKLRLKKTKLRRKKCVKSSQTLKLNEWQRDNRLDTDNTHFDFHKFVTISMVTPIHPYDIVCKNILNN